MDAFAITLEGLALAEWLRYSRWGYAAVSAFHLIGLSLLIGAVVALDLRLTGLWKQVDIELLQPVLSRVAGSGLLLAILSGCTLFLVRASEYVQLELFFVKLGLVFAGVALAVTVNLRVNLCRLSAARQRLIGATSMATWITVLVCGRLLAFV